MENKLQMANVNPTLSLITLNINSHFNQKAEIGRIN